MKTILGLIGGGDRDEVILQTALAAAVPLSAHLDFLHVHVTAGKAARYSRVEFAMGTALRNAMEQLQTKAKTFSEIAADHVREFCAGSKIEICDGPTNGKNVTASFREETDAEIERLTFHARHSDLVVLGRARQTQGLSPDTLEHLVLNCGRPVLVAASAAPRTLTGTAMVCWKESGNAARAVAAATPILTNAKRVVFTSVMHRGEHGSDALHDLARQFATNTTSTDVQVIPANGREIAGLLTAAAEDCGADLVVMGAYGRSRMRELIFGSCTEAFIRASDRPILLMH
jgi:nucleotide-binding universal stress UspA family protein